MERLWKLKTQAGSWEEDFKDHGAFVIHQGRKNIKKKRHLFFKFTIQSIMATIEEENNTFLLDQLLNM